MQLTLLGPLNEALLIDSWKQGIQHHAVMRTSIHWENISKSVQIVHPHADLPWQMYDWRSLSEEEFSQQFDEFLDSDRQTELPLSKAPISRFSLIRKSEREHRLVWTCHHILLDGWGALIILQDVFAYYDGLIHQTPTHLPTPPSYQAYVQWKKQQDHQQARIFWESQLADFQNPTLFQNLPLPPQQQTGQGFEDIMLYLSEEISHHTVELAKQLGVSRNILIKGIWALVLGVFFRREDVLFGMTISGRSGDFPGLELMADQFMNFIPIRIRIDQTISFREWLQGIQNNQIELNRYEHIDVNQILSWAQWPGHVPMFDSLLVFQGWPWETLESGGLLVENLKGGTTSIHPLNVKVRQTRGLECQFHYDSSQISPSVIHKLGELLERALGSLNAKRIPSIASIQKEMLLVPPLELSQPTPNPNGHTSRPKSPAHSQQVFMPANTILESQLLEIWQTLFGQESIGVNDDFFGLGGTSLMAVELFARIDTHLGKSLPPVSLLKHSTIQRLANLIEGKKSTDQDWSSLIAVQPKGSKPPFFAIHGVGGNIFTYRELSKELGEDQPFYGLQAMGMDGKTKPLTNMKDLAAYYISQIQKVQPQGPYLLGGISFGGYLAFEMSKQLLAQGHEVPILAMFDTLADPNHDSILAKRLAWKYRWLERLDLHIGHLLMVGYRQKLRYLWQKLKERLQDRLTPSQDTERDPATGLRTNNKTFIVNHHVARKYELTPLDGKITLFLAQKSYMRFYQDLRLNWHKYAKKGLEIHIVPGNHTSIMMQPHVKTLAAELASCIDRIDA